ncbi:hypothetical protein YB2330_000699 [Saitoella coloradoensis]
MPQLYSATSSTAPSPAFAPTLWPSAAVLSSPVAYPSPWIGPSGSVLASPAVTAYGQSPWMPPSEASIALESPMVAGLDGLGMDSFELGPPAFPPPLDPLNGSDPLKGSRRRSSLKTGTTNLKNVRTTPYQKSVLNPGPSPAMNPVTSPMQKPLRSQVLQNQQHLARQHMSNGGVTVDYDEIKKAHDDAQAAIQRHANLIALAQSQSAQNSPAFAPVPDTMASAEGVQQYFNMVAPPPPPRGVQYQQQPSRSISPQTQQQYHRGSSSGNATPTNMDNPAPTPSAYEFSQNIGAGGQGELTPEEVALLYGTPTGGECCGPNGPVCVAPTDDVSQQQNTTRPGSYHLNSHGSHSHASSTPTSQSPFVGAVPGPGAQQAPQNVPQLDLSAAEFHVDVSSGSLSAQSNHPTPNDIEAIPMDQFMQELNRQIITNVNTTPTHYGGHGHGQGLTQITEGEEVIHFSTSFGVQQDGVGLGAGHGYVMQGSGSGGVPSPVNLSPYHGMPSPRTHVEHYQTSPVVDVYGANGVPHGQQGYVLQQQQHQHQVQHQPNSMAGSASAGPLSPNYSDFVDTGHFQSPVPMNEMLPPQPPGSAQSQHSFDAGHGTGVGHGVNVSQDGMLDHEHGYGSRHESLSPAVEQQVQVQGGMLHV